MKKPYARIDQRNGYYVYEIGFYKVNILGFKEHFCEDWRTADPENKVWADQWFDARVANMAALDLSYSRYG